MTQNWKDVLGYEGYYEVSDQGHVRSVAREIVTHRSDSPTPYIRRFKAKFRKLPLNADGYPTVRLCRDGVCKTLAVHRLMAQVFMPPKPTPRHMVNHIDGVKTNNVLANFEWVTNKENMRHAADVLRVFDSRPRNHVKFTVEDIRYMRALFEQGMGNVEIAALMNCARQTVRRIRVGMIWKDVA